MVRLVVDDAHAIAAVARRFKLSERTVAKWVKRFREHSIEGLHNRSSRPHLLPSQIDAATEGLTVRCQVLTALVDE